MMPIAPHSALYSGSVTHQRLRPRRHRLSYRVFSLLLDLDELPLLAVRLRLFSLNRFNLFSLHERDYGDGRGLRQHVERELAAAGLATGGAVRLLTMPRILGYAFNPLSVYFCDHPQGGLQALLYEVNNTFGQRHSYLIAVEPSQRHEPSIHQHSDKRFHVSPFLGQQMGYDFRVEAPAADREGLRIGITVADADGTLLVAQHSARRRRLDDARLLLHFFSHPLLTLKVMAAIHWEALRLWCKGVPLQPRPPVSSAATASVTVVTPSPEP